MNPGEQPGATLPSSGQEGPLAGPGQEGCVWLKFSTEITLQNSSLASLLTQPAPTPLLLLPFVGAI